MLLRYAENEPWEEYAICVPGRPQTNITGYLPGPSVAPLPLVYNWQMYPDRWVFYSQADLLRLLHIVGQRLHNPVLPWVECPESSQFVHVEKAWYEEPFGNYV